MSKQESFDDDDDERGDEPGSADAEGPSEDDLAKFGDDSGDPSDTVACQHCGEDVYEDADRCPHCGTYIVTGREPAGRRHWTWWVAVAAIAAAAALVLWQTGVLNH